MKRRDFVKAAGLVGAGAATGVLGSLLSERSAHAFGEVPSGAEEAMVPEDLRVESVLEVFLFGGVSQYESFLAVPEFGLDGTDGPTQYNLHLSSGELEQVVSECGFTGEMLQEFSADSTGRKVYLGPYTAPLRERSAAGDVLDRMRICVTSHNALPHEVAVPLALCGRPLGHPALAGLGTHIQRYFLDRDQESNQSLRAYVLIPRTAPVIRGLTRAASATGIHPSAARPLAITMDSAEQLSTLLSRETVGANRQAYDALIDNYTNRFQRRLQWNGGDPLRAPHLAEFGVVSRSLANADAIRAVLAPELLAPIAGSSCNMSVDIDATTMSMGLAAHLLTHPTQPARHVCVIDSGLLPVVNAGGYDTHESDCQTQARNLTHGLKALMNIINRPGEGNPKKLDLDKTLIILNTEFGRTPALDPPTGTGRGHWPFGYPVVYIGGPIRANNRGIFGACGPDAKAIAEVDGGSILVSPQEHRIAALLALGIYPFNSASYNVSDVPGSTSEKQAALTVRQRVLGLT